MEALTYVELDVDYCSLVYGTAPCEAAIGTTGSKKCYNTKFTCQDRPHANFLPTTLRFSQGGRMYEPDSILAMPCIVSIDHQPGSVSLGKDLGERATVTVTLKEILHSDTGPAGDKYLADRGFDPYKQGSYFAKFRTRHRYLRGKPLRIYRGQTGQALSDMDRRTYVVDSFNGPDVDGTFVIVAKDVLKLADNDRAQAPIYTDGKISLDLNETDTVLTLTPAGIGEEYYPSGHVSLSGKECCAYNRSGDTLTLVRGQLGSPAIAHKAGDRVQQVLRYSGVDPAVILYDQLANFAGVPLEFLPLASWQAETAAYLGTLFTANIVEPMGCRDIIDEIIEQATLAVWWDDKAQLVRLQVLRNVSTDAQIFDEENVLAGSVRITEQPDKRLSEVQVFYNQRNPCEKHGPDNFASSVLCIDAQRASDYGSSAIKTILSRWMPVGARAVALRLGDNQLARYKDPPRLFEFSLLRGTYDPSLGGGYKFGSQPMQDDEGLPEIANMQVTRLRRSDDILDLTAEEILWNFVDSGGGGSSTDRRIILDVSRNNVNLRALHDSVYPPVVDVGEITLTCIIDVGVVIGSAATYLNAFEVGLFPVGLPITIIVKGRIQGAAGDGGRGSGEFIGCTSGLPGGTALYTRQAINVDLTEGAGEIFGGGGGGGGGGNPSGAGNHTWGGGGGGGAGNIIGLGNVGALGNGTNGSASAGGTGYDSPLSPGDNKGGNGGNPGQAGASGTLITTPLGNGGAAGPAVDGVSYISFSSGGNVLGPQIN